MASLAVGVQSHHFLFLFKCIVYSALCFTSYEFLMEDYLAAQLILNENSSWSDVINIFSVTIDTVAWLTLLVVFELETSRFGSQWLTKKGKRLLSVISIACYLVIVYALIGYIGKMLMLSSVEPLLENPCAPAGEYLLIVDMDEYESLTQDRCSTLAVDSLKKLAGKNIVFDPDTYSKVIGLAWASVINSLAWILVVAVIQFDILIQAKERLKALTRKPSYWIKASLYLTLLLVASFWGVVGSAVDFLDAVLWLSGFWIIEMNIFNFSRPSSEPD
jgi:hypothetical protein